MSNYDRFRKEIFETKVYDKGIPDRSNLTVLDIGAHVGLFTEYIHPRADIVYAIEPYTPLFEQLKERIENLDLDKAVAYNVAIAKETGERILNVNGGDGGSSFKYGGGGDTVTVQAYSLSDFMHNNSIKHIDVLKIDCEGSEHEIINSESFKEVADRIDHIVGEVHSAVEIENALLKLGFAYEVHDNIFHAYRLHE